MASPATFPSTLQRSFLTKRYPNAIYQIKKRVCFFIHPQADQCRKRYELADTYYIRNLQVQISVSSLFWSFVDENLNLITVYSKKLMPLHHAQI